MIAHLVIETCRVDDGVEGLCRMSRVESLLPHGQPRLTFGEMRLPIPH
jgi:hypothetical protein